MGWSREGCRIVGRDPAYPFLKWLHNEEGHPHEQAYPL
jgi:hypothetical protein